MITETHTHSTRCWWHPLEARWVCAGTPADTAPAADDRPLVDVRDMVVVHTAMLREIRLAPAAVGRVDPGDRRRGAAVTRHLRFVLGMLHDHHAHEDELLWPKLRSRVSGPATAVFDEIEAQHAGIDAALADVVAALDAWSEQRSTPLRDRLVALLGVLHTRLGEHLELEERAVLPLAAAELTQAEWDAVGEAAVAGTPKPELALSFGMFAYEGDPAVLRAMLSSAPAVPRALLPRVAPRLYARRARAVHGTPRP